MSEKLNVVLLTVDSLRADHLGCYGYGRATSPFIDYVARQGVLAEQFIAPSIPTQPSYTTLLTAQYPTAHGIISHGGKAELSREAPILAESFVQEGYATCSVDNLWRQRFWFGRGFEFIIDPSVRRNLLLTVTCDELNQRTIPWIREHKDEPFFVFMHYWDPHYPYVPAPKYRHLFYEGTNPTDPTNHALDPWWETPFGMMARDTWVRTPNGVITDPAFVTAMYDQEVRRLDDGMSDIIGAIDELGLAEKTLIVLIADHGESMTEHGVFYDHSGLHDTIVHVPMIMRLPGRLPAGVRLPRMLQHVDIGPTVLEAAGIDVPSTMEGKSFWRYATGEEQQGGYDEVVSLEATWQACWSIRTDRYKLIAYRDPDDDGRPRRELYDLSVDAAEEHNIVAEQPTLAASLEARMEEWIGERVRAAGRTEDPLREQGISLTDVVAQHL
jgi:arylsulfatase A-like enzyme